MNSFSKASNILKKNNQEHLLSFYDELDDNQKKYLINQICSLDFKQILKLYENSKNTNDISYDVIEPLAYIDKSELSLDNTEKCIAIGEKIIKNNELAVVTLAGGQRN